MCKGGKRESGPAEGSNKPTTEGNSQESGFPPWPLLVVFRRLHFFIGASPPIRRAVFSSLVLSRALVCKVTALISHRLPQLHVHGWFVHGLGLRSWGVCVPLAFPFWSPRGSSNGTRCSTIPPPWLARSCFLIFLTFSRGTRPDQESGICRHASRLLAAAGICPQCGRVCARTSPPCCEPGGDKGISHMLWFAPG